ncbi:hypothetical protein L1887_05039 [Cichorium endivia]|nr:hypothetical protein L1887_33800 [Cichorium endivia]KAI3499453.1 hypothetical protein L1887_35254 [Cichorium endivia]KAI3517132.1 hypothetical protein L1887_16340 [Cichorium endivia]KAI3525907.1 hypothetical protein L1887_05039 [Cichorium endivia]
MTKDMKKKFENEYSNENDDKESDETEVLNLLGVSMPKNVQIHVPKTIKNKGCGTKKRMIGEREKMSVSKAKTRLCTGCNKYAGHNWRTCKERIARDEAEQDNA